MRKIAFDTYPSYVDIPSSALPALVTFVNLGVKLDDESGIKFLTDVHEDEKNSNSILLSWSDDPADGLWFTAKDELAQYAGLLMRYAQSRGMSPAKAAKAVYVVPTQVGVKP